MCTFLSRLLTISDFVKISHEVASEDSYADPSRLNKTYNRTNPFLSQGSLAPQRFTALFV
jgi:hypothetical protein